MVMSTYAHKGADYNGGRAELSDCSKARRIT